MKKFTLMSVIALLFTGCVTSNSNDISNDFKLDQNSQKGLAVLSIVSQYEDYPISDNPPYYGSKVYISSKSNPQTLKQIEVNSEILNPKRKRDAINRIDTNDPKYNTYGILVIKELEQGEYFVSAPEPTMYGVDFDKSNMNKRDKSRVFTVLPGTVTYLGEYGTNIRKSSLPRVYVQDQSDRDLKILTQEYPYIPSNKIMISVSEREKAFVGATPSPRTETITIWKNAVKR